MLSDPLTLIFSIVCLFYAIRGAYFGLTKVLLRIGALIGAYLCAYTGYPPISTLLSQHSPIELPAPLYNALAGCLCLLLAFILFSAIAACIHSGIKKLTARYTTNLLTTCLTRLTAALISCAFGLGLCISGLLGYLIFSKLFPLPPIELTASNQAIINFSEHLIQRIEAGGILRNKADEAQTTPKSAPLIKSQSTQKSDGMTPSGNVKPLTRIHNNLDTLLLKHTSSPKQKQALEQQLNQLLAEDGQLINFIRQNLPNEYQQDIDITKLLEQEDAPKRIAQQFNHLLNDRQALMTALQSLKHNSLSPSILEGSASSSNPNSPALVETGPAH